MYKIFLLLVSFTILSANEFNDLLQQLDENRLLKIKDYEIKATNEYYRSQEGLYYPRIDIKSNYIHLKQTPQIAIHLPGVPSQWIDAGTQNIYDGQLILSYPLFRGYAIKNLVKKAQLQMQMAKLKKDDLKRNLKLKFSVFYGTLYSLKAMNTALDEAKNALESSYNKAKGFYKVGLIPQSELFNIKANFYKIKANISKNNSDIKVLNNNIFYLTSQYAKATTLPNISLTKKDIRNRADIKLLTRILLSNKLDIQLAKANNYPQIDLVASYKKVGNSINLDGDGFTNSDQSYAGIMLKYNIFNGFEDKYKIQSAKSNYFAKKLFLDDYIKKVELNIKNEYLKLDSLKQTLQWANEALLASSKYLKLTLGRFEQQLISSDELNRAIATKAKNKANLEKIKSDIFIQKSKINLISGDSL